ncbi:MAG: four helix bundle protein [Candidatus Kerfeldbacteria bacterium]|nr:four helix bundle protein [Candidatus Kerfeldbacteria bacterium]
MKGYGIKNDGNIGRGKVVTFTDLMAWKQGHALALKIYQITKDFPNREKFGLTSQIRRCALSVTSNIAEGFSRKSFREKAQFYSTALGSLTELQNQLMLARDVQYVSPDVYADTYRYSVLVHKLITGLIKYAKNASRTP